MKLCPLPEGNTISQTQQLPQIGAFKVLGALTLGIERQSGAEAEVYSKLA